MTRKAEEILKRGSNLPELLRNKFNELLLFYVDHEYTEDEILIELEKFLNNFEKEDI